MAKELADLPAGKRKDAYAARWAKLSSAEKDKYRDMEAPKSTESFEASDTATKEEATSERASLSLCSDN